ncbi:MAG TPA: MFS transporter [Flavisolibacter sp.]|nr:MFS transporter [Flavisolibacter sp.]
MFQSSIQLYRNAYSGLSRSMWWLSLVMFINRCGTMVIPFLTVYLTAKGYSLAQAGYVMAAFGGGSILGGYIGGRLTDRFGHLHVQFFSLLLNGILFIVLGQMQTFWQFASCIFVLSSLGEAFRPANSAAIASYSNETNRTRCYSLNRLAINLGWAVGPAVGGFLAGINYALLFWADGITCILASVLLYFVFSPGRVKKTAVHEQVKKTSDSAYRDRTFLKGMFYIFLVGLCFFQMFSTIPVYYKEVVHLKESTIGWVLAMNGLIIAFIEMVMVYKLENRRRPEQYMMAGALLIGLAFLTLYTAREFTVVLSSMIIITFGEMLLFPFMNNFWVKRSTEKNRGQYAALYTMSFSAAIVLAPTFSSQVATWLGFDALWIINFFVCTFASIGFFLLKTRTTT